MTQPTKETVEARAAVIQADRDAAADLSLAMWPTLPTEWLRRGNMPDDAGAIADKGAWVQAFARHRIASLKAPIRDNAVEGETAFRHMFEQGIAWALEGKPGSYNDAFSADLSATSPTPALETMRAPEGIVLREAVARVTVWVDDDPDHDMLPFDSGDSCATIGDLRAILAALSTIGDGE